MSTPETSREPCPDRILDDLGGAFAMGAVGGSAYHFIRGFYNSPRGERFIGGSQAIRLNAPRVGGSFAVWGGLFSCFDCSMVYLRQKEDPWNSVFAGAATGGFLQLRHGLRPTAQAALFGGILLGLIEGAGIVLQRFSASPMLAPAPADDPLLGPPMIPNPTVFPRLIDPMPAPDPAPDSSWSGWFNGFFAKKEKTDTGSKTQILENFDSPNPPPMPTFDYK